MLQAVQKFQFIVVELVKLSGNLQATPVPTMVVSSHVAMVQGYACHTKDLINFVQTQLIMWDGFGGSMA